MWALEEKACGAFAGYAGLWFPQGRSDAEIGYGIVPALRRMGLASEAARFARGLGFNTLGMRRLVSYIQLGNASSIGVAERLGARPGGVFKMAGRPHAVYVHQNRIG